MFCCEIKKKKKGKTQRRDVKKDVNAPKDFTTNCAWAADVFVFSKRRDLELIWILSSRRCLPRHRTPACQKCRCRSSPSWCWRVHPECLAGTGKTRCNTLYGRTTHAERLADRRLVGSFESTWSESWILTSGDILRLQIHRKWSLKRKETCNMWTICHLDWPFAKRLP